MKRKSSKILLIASLLVVTGSGIKLMKLFDVGYTDLVILAGMILGLIGLYTYINEIKKEQ